MNPWSLGPKNHQNISTRVETLHLNAQCSKRTALVNNKNKKKPCDTPTSKTTNSDYYRGPTVEVVHTSK